MCVIPPPCFGKLVLCWLRSFLCQLFFALSCPRPGGFLPALRALWCLPRYSWWCRKPETSFLRPSQDMCIAWKFSICQLYFLTGLIDRVTLRRKVYHPENLPEGAQTFLSLKPECLCSLPLSCCKQNKEIIFITLRLSHSF